MLPKGFVAGGIHSGIGKKKEKPDLALFWTDQPATAAGMFTENLVKAAPVLISRKHLKTSQSAVHGILANSGCANACTGPQGKRDAEASCTALAKGKRVKTEQVLVASTGVIGQFLPMPKVQQGIKILLEDLKKGKLKEADAARAIMTTDTFAKVSCRTIIVGGKEVTVWGCAKGAGMIHPALSLPHATMLAFLLTDVAVAGPLLRETLEAAARVSFNCVSVDGDTSTNDSLFILANGAAGNASLCCGGKEYSAFKNAVREVCLDLAKMLARDGEGATRLIEIEVKNARSESDAKKIAATIATSPLVKTAIFGNDANWGRIIAAAGRAGVPIDPDKISIYLGGILMARGGMAAPFSEEEARKVLKQKEVKITVDLKLGKKHSVYYTCDFSFDYVKVNASYRS